MPHALVHLFLKGYFSICLNHQYGSHNLTYLATYLPLPEFKKHDSSNVRETGTIQCSSPSHSRRYFHDRLKGRAMEVVNTQMQTSFQPLTAVKGHIRRPESFTSDSVFGHTGCNALVMQMCQGTSSGKCADAEGEQDMWHHLLYMHSALWVFFIQLDYIPLFPAGIVTNHMTVKNTGKCTEQQCIFEAFV